MLSLFKGDLLMINKSKFFNNKECDYFPCHKTNDFDNFNCFYCYCPLYALGENCGGNYCYTEGGIKDCSNCMVPHNPESYKYIDGKFFEIAELAKKNQNNG